MEHLHPKWFTVTIMVIFCYCNERQPIVEANELESIVVLQPQCSLARTLSTETFEGPATVRSIAEKDSRLSGGDCLLVVAWNGEQQCKMLHRLAEHNIRLNISGPDFIETLTVHIDGTDFEPDWRSYSISKRKPEGDGWLRFRYSRKGECIKVPDYSLREPQGEIVSLKFCTGSAALQKWIALIRRSELWKKRRT